MQLCLNHTEPGQLSTGLTPHSLLAFCQCKQLKEAQKGMRPMGAPLSSPKG